VRDCENKIMVQKNRTGGRRGLVEESFPSDVLFGGQRDCPILSQSQNILGRIIEPEVPSIDDNIMDNPVKSQVIRNHEADGDRHDEANKELEVDEGEEKVKTDKLGKHESENPDNPDNDKAKMSNKTAKVNEGKIGDNKDEKEKDEKDNRSSYNRDSKCTEGKDNRSGEYRDSKCTEGKDNRSGEYRDSKCTEGKDNRSGDNRDSKCTEGKNNRAHQQVVSGHKKKVRRGNKEKLADLQNVRRFLPGQATEKSMEMDENEKKGKVDTKVHDKNKEMTKLMQPRGELDNKEYEERELKRRVKNGRYVHN